MQIAISIGGIVFAFRSLQYLVEGLSQISGALIAWDHAALVFKAAGRSKPHAARQAPQPTHIQELPETETMPLLVAQGLGFRYHNRADMVLKDCNLQIHPGDRILLQGPSGGGKSTLVALLTGLRAPQHGTLRFRRKDSGPLGTEHWQRYVVAAPQFHENHIMTETFAFNLLMGRRWPPTWQDLQEAEAICRALGLGDLIDRMPAGMLQVVGEMGWQLSHGERSRLYIARALLQGAELVVLDESFAALDPQNLCQALECVIERAPTLLVVAHP